MITHLDTLGELVGSIGDGRAFTRVDSYDQSRQMLSDKPDHTLDTSLGRLQGSGQLILEDEKQFGLALNIGKIFGISHERE